MKYWRHSAKDTLRTFGSRMEGLNLEQVEDNREKFGENKIGSVRKNTWLLILWRQFTSPLIIILIIATVITLLLQEWVDAIVIFTAVFINVALGFFEEFKADRSLEALKAYLPVDVRVRRDGQEMEIRSEEIVVGDILLLRSGDKITADARLVKVIHFETSEAALTGESREIKKQIEVIEEDIGPSDRKNMIFAGTVAVAGKAEAVVVAVGYETELGRITDLVENTGDEGTPLQRQLSRLASWLGFLAILLAILVFVIGIWRGYEFQELFYTAVALAVAAVPEGLTIAMTVILALGMQRILKKQALVRKLVSAETLGSVNVICLDKTGTITTGEMTVAELEKNPHRIELTREWLGLALLNTMEAKVEDGEVIGTPTERGIYSYAHKHFENEQVTIVDIIPFDSKNKFSAALIDTDGDRMMTIIGAPDILIERADLSDEERLWLEEELSKIVDKGERAIAIGVKKVEGSKIEIEDVLDISILGLISLADPVRNDAIESVKIAESAGLHPVMITGDHPKTAWRIAEKIGFSMNESQMLTGKDLDDLSDEQLAQKVTHIRVYARVLPQHKLRIVNAWHARGASVAMTGDGVNDAPAIKAADIGIALGSGTEVAKETADMVLLDDKFSTIIDAIREGRIVFDNIRKVTGFLLMSNLAEVIVVVGSIFFGLPLAILPAQILWINLVTDGIPSLSLMFEKGEAGIMKEGPRSSNEQVVNRGMLYMIIMMGIITSAVLFGLYVYLLDSGFSVDYARTAVFFSLGLSTVSYLFSIRVFRSSMFSSAPWQNPYLIFAAFLGWFLQFVPLMFAGMREAFGLEILIGIHWWLIIGFAIIQLLMVEVSKLFLRTKKKK